ncbi:MAG: outer membrane protein transport protein [bacterium]|nr:outer membrane protein transport protein [bacterium]
MKRSLVVLLVTAAALALAVVPAMAGAFRIPEAGAKAMGFGNAFVGMADDPSAVQFNPAGLIQVEGNQILTGATSITTNSDYTDTGGTKSSAEEGRFLPPFFYYSNHLEGMGDGNWWLGLSVTAPFGLGTEWEVDSFNYVATETLLEMVKLNPTMAYKVNDQWSVGFGVDYYQVLEAGFKNDMSSTYLSAFAGTTTDFGRGIQELSGDATGFGFNVGAMFRPNDDLSFGFAYRTGVGLDVDGTVDVNLKDFPGTPLFTSFDASTTVNLPATAALGVNYVLNDQWQVNFDLDWTGWSAYDELAVENDAGTVLNTLTADKSYDDVIAYRIGVQYDLNETWAIRGGYLAEPNPVPEETYDPRLPDGDRTGYVVGAGYSDGSWTVDFAYMLVQLDAGNVDSDAVAWITPGVSQQNVDGKYDGDITLIGFDVSYAF